VGRSCAAPFPEKCIEALLAIANQRGARLHMNEEVQSWRSSGKGVTLTTVRGEYQAQRLIVAAGPWVGSLADSLKVDLPLEVERQLSHWFQPASSDNRFDAARCPIALWEPAAGEIFATLPDDGHGVKCGMHHAGALTSPNTVDRGVSADENESARRLLEKVMPGAGGQLLASRVCLYTNTPDRHFIVDWLEGQRVLMLSPCSGHGFKFATAIGEVASQLALDGRSELNLSPFSLSRFA
jgi:sarcosine oxidase